MTTQKKLFILIIILFGVGIIALVVYSLIPRASILFSIAPTEATVIINNKKQKITNGERITVTPGEISIEVLRNEFDTYRETITVNNGDEHEVLVALTPQTAAAQSLLSSTEAQSIIQRITGRSLQSGVDNLNATYPILKDLPIVDRFYKIIICESEKYPDDSSKLAVCIQLYEMAARKSALNEIERRGYNLDDYEIIVQDLTYNTLRREAGE